MSETTHVTIGLAFLAGLVSFVSPCVLPLVPAYLSLLTGESLEDLRSETAAVARTQVLWHAIAFVLGFSIVFIALGLTASAIGGALAANRTVISQVGGVLVVILGLQMMGLIRIPFFMRDTRLHMQHDRRTFWTSLLVGVAFAAGWTPCIGPQLSAIFAIASQQHDAQATILLSFYSLGLALPFLAVAAFMEGALPALNRVKRFLPAIEFCSGLFLVAVGFVLVENAFLNVAGWFYQFVPTPKI
jgi:cytochrome c-type biogenesis protein